MPALKCLDCNAHWYRMGGGIDDAPCGDCGSWDIAFDTDPDEGEEDDLADAVEAVAEPGRKTLDEIMADIEGRN